jgi:hypothetical protein
VTEGFFDAAGTRSIGRFVVHDGPAPAKPDDWNDRLEIVPNAGALPWIAITRDKKCLLLPARATPCRIERFAWNGTTLAPLQ